RDVRDAAQTLFQRGVLAIENAREIAHVEAQIEGEGDVAPTDAERTLVSDPDAVAVVEQDLADQIEATEAEVSRLDQKIGSYLRGLEQLRVESHAADAALAAQQQLARVREHAERWCRVKLAAAILAREIERYRDENQGPLLTKASALFSRL